MILQRGVVRGVRRRVGIPIGRIDQTRQGSWTPLHATLSKHLLPNRDGVLCRALNVGFVEFVLTCRRLAQAGLLVHVAKVRTRRCVSPATSYPGWVRSSTAIHDRVLFADGRAWGAASL